jgi:hypothetical protein
LRSVFNPAIVQDMNTRLHHRGREIADSDIEFIRRLIAENPGASRRDLSKKLCEAWNWRQPNGALRDMVCRGLMLQLHRAGHIELPEIRWVNPNPFVARRKPAPVLVDQTPLKAPLAEIGPLEFQQVRRTLEEKLFNSLLDRYHYLGSGNMSSMLSMRRTARLPAWGGLRHRGTWGHATGSLAGRPRPAGGTSGTWPTTPVS